MSSILEALKKSEAERQAGQAQPDPGTASLANTLPRRRRGLLTTLVGGGALILLLVIWQQYRWPPEPEFRPDIRPQTQLETQLETRAAEDTATMSVPDNEPAVGTRRPSRSSDPGPAAGTVVGPDADQSGSSANTGLDTLAESAPSPATQSSPSADRPAPDVRTIESQSPPSPVEVVTAPRPPNQAAPAPVRQQAQEPPPKPGSRLPHFNQLPALQADIGPLQLTMLVFSADPARRFALVNGKRLSEGQSLANGVKLLEIRRSECRFSANGQQFVLRSQ